jgi:integrase
VSAAEPDVVLPLRSHTQSSLLDDVKVPVKIAQEQLGHASIATTLNARTLSMRRTGKPSKRSKSGYLARRTVLD